MKATIKFFVKIFIITTVFFGFISVIPKLISNQQIEINGISIRSLIFGLLMSLIIGLVQIVRMKKNGIKIASDLDFKVNQNATLTSKLTLQEIFDKLKTKYKSINLTSDKIVIKTNMNFYSWGETIEIKKLNNELEYEITSKPQFSTTLIDFGKNRENIFNIQKSINNFA